MIFSTPPAIYQVSAFEALRAGKYDGTYDVRNLTKHGDFGLGTYNGLDGEMVVLGGHMYQINAFGEAKAPRAETKTPFAFVTYFHPARTFNISSSMTSKQVQAEIDKRFPTGFLAIHISGQLTGLQSRSFAPQQKPYQPFAKIGDRQSMLPYGKTAGDLVGFRMPATVGTLSVPGYHFHFISTNRKHGGHVLAYGVQSGKVELMPIKGIDKAKL